MNDTTSQSMQPRRGARRWLALLASFTIVATMAGTASAEGGPSDDDIISRSAWGVYNTSRVFEPWADGPLPGAERLCASHICLPISALLTEEQAEHVVQP